MTGLRRLYFPDPDRRRAVAEACAAGKGLPAPRRYAAWVAIILGLMLAVLDGTIANVALPSIARHFSADPASSIWIVNGYLLAIVMTLLPLAALADIYGYRTVYLGGIALFTVASVGCVFAGSLGQLTAARVIQGLGASGLMAINMSILRYTVARENLGAAIGLNAMIVAIAATVGPVVAGAILSVTTWHWLFAINIPLGILTLLIGWPSLPESLHVPRRFDWISAILSAAGLGLAITAIDGIGNDLPAWLTLTQLMGGIIAFALLLLRERGAASPMLPVDLLRIPVFSLSVTTSIVSFTAQLLAFVSLPFLLQNVMGHSPSVAGLLMMPWPLAIAVVAPIAGRLSGRFPPAILGGLGLAALAAGLLALSLMSKDAAVWDIAWRMALCGAGFGLFQSPNNRVMIESAPMWRSGAASGMLGTARLTGQSLGAALVALLMGQFGLEGASLALFLGSVFAVLAAGLSMSRLALRKNEDGRADAAKPPADIDL